MAGNCIDGCGEITRERKGGRRRSEKDHRNPVANSTRQDFHELQSYDEFEQEDDYEDYFYDDRITDEELSVVDPPLCTKDIHTIYHEPSTSRGACPRKDVLAKLAPTNDVAGIRGIIEQVTNGEISTAAEFIFCLAPHVRDRGVIFREILERELSYFRDLVNDTVDRRIQDEADVMMHTQNDIKDKFRSLTDAMIQRMIRIRQRLYEISPKFDWANDGRDRAKITKFCIKPVTVDTTKRKPTNTSNAVDKLIHQVFMRGQWLKKELTRLQDENDNLQYFLDQFRTLAAERKETESHVPRILSMEKEELERELNALRKTHKRNLEIIDALCVEHHRCIKPQSDASIVD